MRALIFDELRREDVARVREYLAERATAAGIEDIYWVEMAEDRLTGDQAEHVHCQPHRFAVEVGKDFIKIELFIRPAEGLRCHCAGYAEADQRNFIIDWADRLVIETNLKT